MSLLDKIDKENVPQHVAIIMDGNGRWAKSKGLDRTEGHKEGAVSVRKVAEAAARARVKFLTLYAFSTENWLRPQEEVNMLMELMVHTIAKETENLIKNGIRVQAIGDLQRLPKKTKSALLQCIEQTSSGKNLTLVVALSYSSRWELANAAKAIAVGVKNGVLDENSITEETISEYLATKDMPELDLLIRTGGEIRISNFLLWQAAYAELYFTDTFWPDFDEKCLYEAILDFQKKERRFGKTSEQLEKENQ
ncbi:MAG: isoprenyl transferase [Petrimonas sp.]|jgi:undecaprenyl diphosphate synthase|nr:MAG: Ditrans,polycis-undecaprenyl-diphosphate synthase ((2E,6E)-farnesyl-diphosphate specific) [Bacteroidetes bacterium ADurb.BinA174]